MRFLNLRPPPSSISDPGKRQRSGGQISLRKRRRVQPIDKGSIWCPESPNDGAVPIMTTPARVRKRVRSALPSMVSFAYPYTPCVTETSLYLWGVKGKLQGREKKKKNFHHCGCRAPNQSDVQSRKRDRGVTDHELAMIGDHLRLIFRVVL